MPECVSRVEKTSSRAWCIVPGMPYYDTREWRIARSQALHNAG